MNVRPQSSWIPAGARMMFILVGGVFLWPAILCWGSERVTVDFDIPVGTAGDPVAAGFRGTWWDSIPEALITELKPSTVGGPSGHEGDGDEENPWTMAAAVGATVEIAVYDGFGLNHSQFWDSCDDCGEGQTIQECYDSTMAVWGDLVRQWVEYAEESRIVGEVEVPVRFDVWNEPDGGEGDWNPAECFGDSHSLFLDMWDTAVDTIRGLGGVVVGPSFAGGAVGDVHGNGSGITLDLLLPHWMAAGSWPDVFAWHHNANSDFRSNEDSDSLQLNLLNQVLYAKQRIAKAGGDTATMRYEVNEMLLPDAYLTPGYLVRNYALAERARGEGLISVGRTYWCSEPCQPETTGCDPSLGSNWCYGCPVGEVWWPLQWTRLQGLVCPYGPDIWQKRYAWWTQKAYADLAGSYIGFAPGDSSDGLASVDTTAAIARVLVGNYSAVTSSALTLVLKNVPNAIIINEAVRVSITRHPGNPDSIYVAGVVPDERPVHNYVVVGDSVVVEIGSSDFQPGDALDVEISKIEPDSTIAPG